MIRTLLLFLIISQSAIAALTLWTPAGYDHTFILPENVTPKQFLQIAKAHPQNSHYVQDLKMSPNDRIEIVSKIEGASTDRSLLIANAPGDHNQKQTRVRTFTRYYSNAFLLPVGAAHSLSPEDRIQFYTEVTQNFGVLMPMGGDDVDPAMYGEKVTWAEGFDRFRDQLEIELIQYFYKNSSGKIFGICRGMQITCVALGGKLNQDLINDLGVQEDHKDGAFHEIYLTGPKDHVGTQLLASFSEWKGNSWHHQSLNKESLINTPLTVIAESIEGVVEAAASSDNRILLLQSHPEKSDPKSGQADRFFKRLKKWVTDRSVIKSCRQALKLSH